MLLRESYRFAMEPHRGQLPNLPYFGHSIRLSHFVTSRQARLWRLKHFMPYLKGLCCYYEPHSLALKAGP